MIIYLKLKHIVGVIERSFLDIYTHAEHLRMWIHSLGGSKSEKEGGNLKN